MKQLVETTQSIGLIDVVTGVFIHDDRPTVVPVSTFTQERLAIDLKVLSALSDEATDEEFVRYWHEAEGDHELAVSSFLSAFGPTVVASGDDGDGDGDDGEDTLTGGEGDGDVAPKRRGRPRKNAE